jgi:hypothetical protein
MENVEVRLVITNNCQRLGKKWERRSALPIGSRSTGACFKKLKNSLKESRTD